MWKIFGDSGSRPRKRRYPDNNHGAASVYIVRTETLHPRVLLSGINGTEAIANATAQADHAPVLEAETQTPHITAHLEEQDHHISVVLNIENIEGATVTLVNTQTHEQLLTIDTLAKEEMYIQLPGTGQYELTVFEGDQVIATIEIHIVEGHNSLEVKMHGHEEHEEDQHEHHSHEAHDDHEKHKDHDHDHEHPHEDHKHIPHNHPHDSVHGHDQGHSPHEKHEHEKHGEDEEDEHEEKEKKDDHKVKFTMGQDEVTSIAETRHQSFDEDGNQSSLPIDMSSVEGKMHAPKDGNELSMDGNADALEAEEQQNIGIIGAIIVGFTAKNAWLRRRKRRYK